MQTNENGERQSAYPYRQGINPTYLRTAKITKKSVNPNYIVELPEVESGSYTRAHTDFIHTLRIAIYVRLQDKDGIQRPISTTRFLLSGETENAGDLQVVRQWPARIRRYHEERRTPRPYCAGYGPCPRHCKEYFCRLLVRCFIQLGSPPSA